MHANIKIKQFVDEKLGEAYCLCYLPTVWVTCSWCATAILSVHDLGVV